MPLSRVGMATSIFAWGIVYVAAHLAAPERSWIFAQWILFLAIPVLAGAIAVTYAPRLKPWVLPATMAGNAMNGSLGVPLGNPNHAGAAADLALAMRTTIEEFSASGSHGIRLRMGLCSGPVVAGVIGATKFAYDLWGDTVNTAARMESHSVDGQIQVSESTWRKLSDGYLFEERGVVQIKGKGPMSTWLLLGCK